MCILLTIAPCGICREAKPMAKLGCQGKTAGSSTGLVDTKGLCVHMNKHIQKTKKQSCDSTEEWQHVIKGVKCLMKHWLNTAFKKRKHQCFHWLMTLFFVLSFVLDLRRNLVQHQIETHCDSALLTYSYAAITAGVLPVGWHLILIKNSHISYPLPI